MELSGTVTAIRAWWRQRHRPRTSRVEEAHGGCDYDLAKISRDEAEEIAAERAARYWPPDAARLPWVASVYPGGEAG
jgi:hypothetical protein